MFHRSVILVDRPVPDRGVVPHALEMAQRLDLPVQLVSFSTRSEVVKGGEWARRRQANDDGEPGEPLAVSSRARSSWAATCARCGLHSEWSRLEGDQIVALRKAVAPDDLLGLDQGMPTATKAELLCGRVTPDTSAVLVGSKMSSPLSRVLLIDQGGDVNDGFLSRAAGLSQQLRMEVIVLTIARSERSAKQRQEVARELVGNSNLSAGFDFMVGVDVGTAVSAVARWRRCQLVVVRREESPWWRWMRSPSAGWFMNLDTCFSVMSLPPLTSRDCVRPEIIGEEAGTTTVPQPATFS
jgi:hypothetical protein